MHEVGIMEEILDTAMAAAAAQNATQIHRITVVIGALSGVSAPALQFAFQALSPGTMAEGSAFELIEKPAICFCTNCEIEFSPEDVIYVCPRCASLSSEIRSGRELELSTLEVS